MLLIAVALAVVAGAVAAALAVAVARGSGQHRSIDDYGRAVERLRHTPVRTDPEDPYGWESAPPGPRVSGLEPPPWRHHPGPVPAPGVGVGPGARRVTPSARGGPTG